MKIRLPVVTGAWEVDLGDGTKQYGSPEDPARPKYFDLFPELRDCHLSYNLAGAYVDARRSSFPEQLLAMEDVEEVEDDTVTFEAAVAAQEKPEKPPEKGSLFSKLGKKPLPPPVTQSPPLPEPDESSSEESQP